MDAYNTSARQADPARRQADYELRMEHGLPVSIGRYPGTDPLEDLRDGEEDDDS